MKKAILFGFGNVGKHLSKKLLLQNIELAYIVRSNGVFDSGLIKQGDLRDWKSFTNEIEVAFIAIPTVGKGEKAFEYESFFLERKIPVITCEKASIANNFEYLKRFENIFKYNASVGGGTRMLGKISEYQKENIFEKENLTDPYSNGDSDAVYESTRPRAPRLLEIKAVVNGTLNFIGDNLRKGKGKTEIAQGVLEKGYAEPGATNFEEIVKGEMNDVVLKTVIIANASGLFPKVVKPEDVVFDNTHVTRRCILKITREKIEVGFLEENDASWLPEGVNNKLYINDQKVCEGPGAGAEATVESMLYDLKTLI